MGDAGAHEAVLITGTLWNHPGTWEGSDSQKLSTLCHVRHRFSLCTALGLCLLPHPLLCTHARISSLHPPTKGRLCS